MTKISYAQNFEDVILGRVLADVAVGHYIDVGANHPDTYSVTRSFYDAGWSGINLEPIPSLVEALDRARPRDVNLAVAVGAAPGTGTLTVADDFTGLSSLGGVHVPHGSDFGQVRTSEITVQVVTLDSVLGDYPLPEIHFAKIDVEGFERAVLEGFDLATHRPWVLVIEATAPMTQVDVSAEWEHLVVDRGYSLVYHDGLNRFYLAQERGDLADRFRYPPNVFDDFATNDLISARRETTVLKRQVLAMQASVSWRITAPLRALDRLLRRRR